MKHKFASSTLATALSLLAVGSFAYQGAPGQATTTGGSADAVKAGGVKGPAQGPAGTAGQGAQTGATGGTAAATAGALGKATTKQGTNTPGAKPGGAPPMVKPKPPKPPWTEFKLNGKTTMFLDFTDANPDQIISLFSRTSGITILKDPSLKIAITVTSAKSVGLNEAFEIFNTALGLNGYELQKQGNLMIVGKKQPPQPQMPQGPPPTPPPPPVEEKPVIKVYKLTYASAGEIARVVNEVFSQQQLEQIIQQLANGGGGFQPQPQFGGRPQGPQQPKAVRASSEQFSNSVIVTAMAKFQDDVEKLVKELDKPVDAALISETFQLKYVSTDEVVDAVNSVLTSNSPLGKGGAKQQQDNNNPYGYYGGYNPFGSQGNKAKANGQNAIGLKQTNTVIVSATKENMDVVKQLIESIDKPSAFLGTTFVVHLENAKASDVATLLNAAFTKRKDSSQDDNPFFFIYSDFGQQKKDSQGTDYDENGHVVKVRDLTSKVNVIADPNTNDLVIVTLPSNMKLVQSIIDKIDKIAEQVMIETVIVEASLDKTTKLGVEFNFLQNKVLNNSKTTGSGKSDFGLQTAPSTAPLQGFQYTLTGANYKAFLNALDTDTRFKVLSTPRIFTSNNVKSEINVSQKVPYITSQSTGAVGNLISNYDFLDVGVVLTVTPRVTSSGQVTMDVVQSADDLERFTSFNAPVINHRQAQTTVSVNDGETIILGGIIRNTTSRTDNKIPLLGDIPLIGNLFKSSTKETGQTELLVLLTPHIVRTPADAQRLKEEQLKKLTKDSQEAIKNLTPPPPGSKSGG